MSVRKLLTTPLRIGNVTVRNRIVLAPMSGITDEAFRKRAFEAGAGLVVSEMVASGELVKGREGSRKRLRHPGVGVHMVQLAGCRADALAAAAKIAESEGAEIIDINMGCPAKKVIGGYAGSALMRDLDQAIGLVDAVVEAVSVPVTVKMRLGWDDDTRNAPELARRAENAGVAMVTIHGRTRCQFYQGSADWSAIRGVRDAVSIPVVANGDVCDAADAQSIAEQSGADAVMIGRASFGAPWTAGSIVSALKGTSRTGLPANSHALAEYVIAHYEDMLVLLGVESGLRQARKHLGWYLDKHAPGCRAETRIAMLRSTEPRDVITRLREAFETDAGGETVGMAA